MTAAQKNRLPSRRYLLRRMAGLALLFAALIQLNPVSRSMAAGSETWMQSGNVIRQAVAEGWSYVKPGSFVQQEFPGPSSSHCLGLSYSPECTIDTVSACTRLQAGSLCRAVDMPAPYHAHDNGELDGTLFYRILKTYDAVDVPDYKPGLRGIKPKGGMRLVTVEERYCSGLQVCEIGGSTILHFLIGTTGADSGPTAFKIIDWDYPPDWRWHCAANIFSEECQQHMAHFGITMPEKFGPTFKRGKKLDLADAPDSWHSVYNGDPKNSCGGSISKDIKCAVRYNLEKDADFSGPSCNKNAPPPDAEYTIVRKTYCQVLVYRIDDARELTDPNDLPPSYPLYHPNDYESFPATEIKFKRGDVLVFVTVRRERFPGNESAETQHWVAIMRKDKSYWNAVELYRPGYDGPFYIIN